MTEANHAAAETVTYRHLAGDWMTDGYVNNLNRTPRLHIAIVDGRAYSVGRYGDYDLSLPLQLDAAGEIVLSWGEGFLPNPGELERIGGVIA